MSKYDSGIVDEVPRTKIGFMCLKKITRSTKGNTYSQKRGGDKCEVGQSIHKKEGRYSTKEKVLHPETQVEKEKLPG